MKFVKRYFRELIVAGLILANIFVFLAMHARGASGLLRVYFLDIGQGDAIFIDSPTHGRMLIDGGKNRKVVSELGSILPFADNRIDLVLATHPDADHIGGLPEVFARYDVSAYLYPGVRSENNIDEELDKRVEAEGATKVLARRGMVVNFGDGAKLEILFPNQDVNNWETNRASVVAKLVYGEKSFLLTGDSPIDIENVLVRLDKADLDIDVLKAGHHGSRTSTSLAFAEATSPEYAVISAGKDNTYGHPHKEVLDILKKVGAKVVSTIDMGTIEFETDGKILEMR